MVTYMNEISLLGVSFKDYTLRESLQLTEEFLFAKSFHTAMVITSNNLLDLHEQLQFKQSLEEIDLPVIGDESLLKAAGLDTRNRVREVVNGDFLKELLGQCYRNKRSVYLVAMNEKELMKLQELLDICKRNLYIVGTCLCDEVGYNRALLVNEINQIAPHLIVSNVSLEIQMDFLKEMKDTINGNIWLGIDPQISYIPKKTTIFQKVQSLLHHKAFERKITKYKN